MLKVRLDLRKMVVMAICLAGSVTVFAQDIIIMKNGNDIQAIVEEVGIDDVKYKRFDNQDGPNYMLNKSEIFMIRYENGSKDVFSEITTPTPAVEQQLPTLKYTFGNQISPYGSEKSPLLAGFLSFLIPGVGQFYNGDVGGGLLYLGCNIVCNSIWMNAVKIEYDNWGYATTTVDETTFMIGFMGALVVNISSIVHASQGAKKVNIARGYRLSNNTYLKIQPTMIQQNNLLTGNGCAYGMNLCLNF